MTQKNLTTWALAFLCSLGCGAAAFAQDSSALLDALVRKKVLTPQEAEDVRADLIKENAETNAGKLQLSNSVTSLKLYGDIRLRYQYDDVTPQVPASTEDNQRSRERIRLRLNGDFTLAGGFFGGVQLQTVQNSDSANQTMGDPGTGAAGFSNYNIYISRAYFGWANDWLTLVGGKQPNPFYTTDLVWDPDINPEGFVEKIDLLNAFSAARGCDANLHMESPYSLSLTTGQFVFCDNNEYNDGSVGNLDAWIFDTQLVGSAKLGNGVKVTVAPGYMAYTPGNVTNNIAGGAAGKFNENAFYGKDACRDLSIITAPGDVSFTVWGLKAKVLWDFAYNTQGAKREEDVYGIQDILIPVKNTKGAVTGYCNADGTLTSTTPFTAAGHKTQDDVAWLAGIQVGENKKTGDWSVMGNFRQTGISSVDPNLNDSDFALGQLNMQGIKTGVSYNLTDFCVTALTYFDGWNLRENLVGGQATTGEKIASANTVQIIQLDLNLKF